MAHLPQEERTEWEIVGRTATETIPDQVIARVLVTADAAGSTAARALGVPHHIREQPQHGVRCHLDTPRACLPSQPSLPRTYPPRRFGLFPDRRGHLHLPAHRQLVGGQDTLQGIEAP